MDEIRRGSLRVTRAPDADGTVMRLALTPRPSALCLARHTVPLLPSSIRTVSTGSLLGSLVVVSTSGALVLLGQVQEPLFVAHWQLLFGGGWLAAAVFGGAAFVLIGKLWCFPFAAVPNPTVLKGMAYGVLPAFWELVPWPIVLGEPILAGGSLKGVVIAVVLSVVIWGGLLGWYAGRQPAPARGSEREVGTG